MAQGPTKKELFWAELERLGEDAVRARLAAGTYQRVNRQLAEEWTIAQERLRSDASQSEQMAIARSAKDAAWEAASAARDAAKAARQQAARAKTANIIAAIALAVAIASIIISLWWA